MKNTAQEQRAAILANWGDFINEAKAPSDNVKSSQLSDAKKWIIAQIAHNKHYINEGYTSPVAGSVNGIGPVALPASPGSYADFHDPARQVGSGDSAIVALGLSMSIAAHTIAFDLVPTVPINSELVMVEFSDTIYSGGKLNSATKPTFVKITCANLHAETLTAGDDIHIYGANGAASAKFKFVQYARLEKAIIVRFESAGTYTTVGPAYTEVASTTLNAVAAAATNYIIGAGSAEASGTVTINFVNPNDDSIARVFGNDSNLGLEPMDRETQEAGNRNKIELKTYSKPVQAKAYSVEGIITRQQARLYKSKGLDGVPMLKKAMQNEVTQAINDDILDRMRKLGVTTHANLYASQNVNFHLFIGPAATANKALTAFPGVAPMVDMRGTNRTAEFGNITNAETNSAAENMYSRQARLRSRILAAAAAIGTISRFGAADACVVNGQLLAAIKESKGWQPSQVENTLTTSVNALYFAGTISDVKVFCNPKMDWDDTTVIVCRTNKTADGNDVDNLNQGIVFMPYDLAASVDIIDPANMSPRFLVESVYAITETGIHPNLAYLTFAVANDFGMWS